MHKHIVIDNFITASKADDLINIIDDIINKRENCTCSKHEIQTIIKMPYIVENVWKQTKEKLLNSELSFIQRNSKTYKLIGLSDSVTLSRHNTPIEIHRDVEGKINFQGKKYNNLKCFYKIALYLNQVNSHNDKNAGGTILYDDDKIPQNIIIPKKGRALIFDIRDLHSGGPIPKGRIKYLIGFRLLYCEV
jgi:hypothetical protein